jgi:para-nitrobenzyl esterase
MKSPMLLLPVLIFVGSALVSLVGKTAETPPVKLADGLISGTTNPAGDIRIYRGIPFAAPPVGELRWKAPQPAKPWSGIRKCDTFGPSPMQPAPAAFNVWSDEFLIPKAPISEDCLYLNVWTGAKPTGSAKQSPLRPVLVWIYGGGFGSGGAGVPIYDGEALAKKGIVFVSFNYRVGPFGFFAHPELTTESGKQTSGNYGLMDQIAALNWVKKNIAAFGGDPGQVTIAGQSAGSMSVNCLVASPLASGLFTKAIAESGANFSSSYAGLKQAEEAGLKLMQAAGAKSLTDLRALPAADIMKQSLGMRGPIVDGYVLPESIASIFAARKQNDVILLTGWNQDEGMSFGPPKSAAQFRQQMESQFGKGAQAVLTHYPSTTDAEAADSERKLSRDMIFGVQNYAWASTQARQGKPVFVYRFTRAIPAVGEYANKGAFHTGEVAYAYDNLKFINHDLRPLTATDADLAKTMSTYWVNFIKTSDPNGKGLPQWPRFDLKEKQVMMLGDNVKAHPIPDGAALDGLFSVLNQKPN